MKLGKRIVSLLLCFVMVASMVVTGAGAVGTTGTDATEQWVAPAETDASGIENADNVVEFTGGNWTEVEKDEEQFEQTGDLHSPDDLVEVIVVLEEEPLIKDAVASGMEGDIPSYMQSTGSQLEQELLDSHDAARAQIQAVCGDEADTQGYDYTMVLNGFSMTMPYGKIAEAEALPGIKYIRESRTYTVPEDQSSYDLAMANSTGMIGSDEVNDMSFNGADGAGTLFFVHIY